MFSLVLMSTSCCKPEDETPIPVSTTVNDLVGNWKFTSLTGSDGIARTDSAYLFDKYAVSNLCRCLPKKYNVAGIYHPNIDSFWFPNLIVYKMNIEEFILFNPGKTLFYVKEVT